jgi:DNA polymerase V
MKSFYASVECVARKLDPLKANLLVADESRTDKTICLAVSPALKSIGVPSRPRLFEAKERIRQYEAISHTKVDYIIAPPRMGEYIRVSSRIYEIFRKYVADCDAHVYSIDELFIDVSPYLHLYKAKAEAAGVSPAHYFAITMIRDILKHTGITATVGIGTNLYLAKVGMDIVAKKAQADKDGVRIAELTQRSYQLLLWPHKPLTDFWQIGYGTARTLQSRGIYTMGDIAMMSLSNEGYFYDLFGINAELLIDHAWGIEPCTIADIKAYRPVSTSLSNGQVLPCPYSAAQAKLILKEMTDQLSLSLAGKRLVTDQIVLTVCYDVSSAKDYQGELRLDHYGRPTPKEAHGSENLGERTNSTKALLQAAARLYDRIVDPALAVRRIYVVANHTLDELAAERQEEPEQLSLFTDYAALAKEKEKKQAADRKEKRMQGTILDIRGRYGKNAILRGMNYEEGATAKERNNMVGGHMG